MGQKVHPIGFRLGITEEHKSRWYAKPSNYSQQLQVDNELRQIWTNILVELDKKQIDETADRYNLLIMQPPTRDQIHLHINTTNPDLLINDLKNNSYSKELSKVLTQYLGNKKLVLVINKIKHPLLEPNLLAQSIAKKLEKRMPFRRATRKILDDFKKGAKKARLDAKHRGIKIQVAGRLNGAEIARTEWVREGKVPLHTIKAKVGYACERAQTIYGILGIKVWVCKG
uniref:Small ribosomal subunit protein uS3c n=1 Tax=Eustigmatophyceae sp. Mont 10/10-1w TaxID=2506145 RepID=A0A3R5QLT4_9STRA|nr:ribosomal protein S3 [Eustigmatophyceae sp. Mont 10/10-1w]QAA11670.1 ribosomal protein S3 [Eustigmatophyceae sp. Mont 10/10-1w]